MAAADHDRALDLYQLLGVPREASRDEIALAWRRRARDEHPDARPADAGAPGRFRALAEAWQVLGDPARRAAYDRSLTRAQQAAALAPGAPVQVPVRHLGGPARGQPLTEATEPPLRAGPVRVESARAASPAGNPLEEEIRLAILAELTLRYMRRPW
jgi:curved DNA-binding protein CbpA